MTARRADATKASSVEATAQADAQMTSLLGRLMVVAEAYPDLKASQNFQDLQERALGDRGRAAERAPLLQCDRSRLEHDRPELPAGPHRASVRLQGGALLRGRGSGDPKRSQGVVRTPGGLAMAFVRRLLAALLLLGAATAARRGRAHPPLRQRRPDPEGSLARGHRDRSTSAPSTTQINRGIFRDFPTRYRGPRGSQVRVGFTFRGRDAGRAAGSGCDRVGLERRPHQDRRSRTNMSTSATTATSSATARRARSAASRISTNSTGTRPATAGCSRSTSPRRGSACPSQPSSVSARLTPARRARRLVHARVVEEKPGEIAFRTTMPLGPYEGLTVAVAFPKGVVAEPTQGDRTKWMIADYGPPVVGVLAARGPARIYYFFAWKRAGRDPRAGTIVPLFSPPDDLTPAAMRYIMEDGRGQSRLRRRARRHGRSRPRPPERGGRRLFLTRQDAARAHGRHPAAPRRGRGGACARLAMTGESIVMEQKNHAKFSAAQKGLGEVLKERTKAMSVQQELGMGRRRHHRCFVAAFWLVGRRGGRRDRRRGRSGRSW